MLSENLFLIFLLKKKELFFKVNFLAQLIFFLKFLRLLRTAIMYTLKKKKSEELIPFSAKKTNNVFRILLIAKNAFR